MYDFVEQLYNNTYIVNDFFVSPMSYDLNLDVDDYMTFLAFTFMFLGIYNFLYMLCFWLLKITCNVKSKYEKLQWLLEAKILNIETLNQSVKDLEHCNNSLLDHLEKEKTRNKLIEWQNDCLFDLLEKLKEDSTLLKENIEVYDIIQNHYRHIAKLSLYSDLEYLEVYRKRLPKRISAMKCTKKIRDNLKEKDV